VTFRRRFFSLALLLLNKLFHPVQSWRVGIRPGAIPLANRIDAGASTPVIRTATRAARTATARHKNKKMRVPKPNPERALNQFNNFPGKNWLWRTQLKAN
jgi:hypothetical protein